MYIRNYEGNLVKFDWRQYRSEKQLYCALWKILYNVTLKEATKTNKELINFIR